MVTSEKNLSQNHLEKGSDPVSNSGVAGNMDAPNAKIKEEPVEMLQKDESTDNKNIDKKDEAASSQVESIDLKSGDSKTGSSSSRNVVDRLERKRLRQLERAKRQQTTGVQDIGNDKVSTESTKKKIKKQGKPRRRRKPPV